MQTDFLYPTIIYVGYLSIGRWKKHGVSGAVKPRRKRNHERPPMPSESASEECFEENTLWLTQLTMAELFQTTKQNVSQHIQTICETGELTYEATVKNFLTVRKEGAREVRRTIEYYSLDMIIAVGYRVNSRRTTQFRSSLVSRLKSQVSSQPSQPYSETVSP